jgi:FkbM family methyltransferase
MVYLAIPLNDVINRINDGPAGKLLEKARIKSSVREVYRAIVEAGTEDVRDININGKIIRLGQQSFVEIRTLEAFTNERPVIEDLCDRVTSTDVIWDIGANIGAHSCAIKKTNPEAKVIAFEPVPQTANRIQANSELNDVEINVQQFAISNTDGEIQMNIEAESSISSQNSLSIDDGDITVESARADSLLQRGIEQPSVLKIDVEGAEGLVLEGAPSVISKSRLVYCEVHLDRIGDFGSTYESIRKQFTDLGFETDEFHQRNNELFLRCTKSKN